jgi:hypothetical protein
MKRDQEMVRRLLSDGELEGESELSVAGWRRPIRLGKPIQETYLTIRY